MSDVLMREPLVRANSIQPAWETAFRNSRWFTRGWTLQELLAPHSVELFSQEEELIGNKITLEGLISEITGINTGTLRGESLSRFDHEQRFA